MKMLPSTYIKYWWSPKLIDTSKFTEEMWALFKIFAGIKLATYLLKNLKNNSKG